MTYFVYNNFILQLFTFLNNKDSMKTREKVRVEE